MGGKFCVKVQLCIISITVKVKSITSDDVTQIDAARALSLRVPLG